MVVSKFGQGDDLAIKPRGAHGLGQPKFNQGLACFGSGLDM